MTKEQDFYAALREVFVGAEIEGESGFINLMRMKSRYFQEVVFPQLQADIEAALESNPSFRDELFDKLYDFFHRYFSESGSIYFRQTRYPQSVYEQVYSDEKDVILFWKTHMLYYVKTDRLFRSMEVEVPLRVTAGPATEQTQRFFFDVATLEHKQSNEKRDLVYRLERVREDGTIVFAVEYSRNGSKTRLLDMLKGLRDAEEVEGVGEDVIQRAVRVFEKQSEVDFFINKDAGRFLKEQFDLWMYRYLFEGENVWLQYRLKQLQRLKELAYTIIDFIAQFEDELVRVWNKPKFARDSHYVITLDRIAERDAALLGRVLAHAGMAEQVAEWRELGMVDAAFTPADVWQRDLFGQQLDARYQYLPLDTRYVPDLEMDIVGLFEHLDAALDGWLIHSENYQALNTLRPRFRGRVKCVYADPPYNTTASEILYENKYRHSSWLSLMANRVPLAKSLMDDKGIFCMPIDDFELPTLVKYLRDLFGQDNHLTTVAVRNNPHGRAMASGFSPNHEYALFFGKTEEAVVGRLPRMEEDLNRYPETDANGFFAWINFRKTGAGSNREDRPKLFYPVYVSNDSTIRIPSLEWSEEDQKWIPHAPPGPDETVVLPIDSENSERVWNLGWERAQREIASSLIAKRVEDNWQIYRKYHPNQQGYLPGTWWDDAKYSATESGTRIIKNLLGGREVFSYPKSIYLVEDCLRASNCTPESYVLDFFAGSGTTAHAVMNLNREDGGHRKYILVEMGEHFETVILPRVKKVAFSSEWKDGVAQEDGEGMSHFVKYYALEQYEDTLRNTIYVDDAKSDAAPFVDPYTDVYRQYVFLADLKQLHAVDIDPETRAVHVDLTRLYPDIDLAETLANLHGQRIAHLTAEAVTFEDGERVALRDPDWDLIKPLIWW